jgi:hypothetical protein
VKVAAYITASVDNGPWVTVPLTFDTDAPIMRFEFGDEGDLLAYETADPEFRAQVERMYKAFSDHSLQPASRVSGA